MNMNGHAEAYKEIITPAEPLRYISEDLRSVYLSPNALQPLRKKYNAIIKRVFDITASGFAILFVLSWLIPLAGCLIKFNSSGPVFFVQKRNKKDGNVFNCIKFRTMIVNEDADMKGAYENDKRITRIGNFFRKTHLDELPQFINVLMGDMSFVGPRPLMIMENLKNEALMESYHLRYHVKPGITGLAQSVGHYGFTEDVSVMKARLEMDLRYINNWSVKMDLLIICRTLINLFR